MKKFISILLVGALALSLAACGGNSETLSGKVATDGSTSMEKVIGALKETYEGENKGVEVTYNPTGSSAGITAVAEGRCDIGLSSRNLKDVSDKPFYQPQAVFCDKVYPFDLYKVICPEGIGFT